MSKKRAIFQEVSDSEKPIASNSVGIIEKNSNEKIKNTIQLWLKTLFFLIVLIILVGGLTRLTDSGLSITELYFLFSHWSFSQLFQHYCLQVVFRYPKPPEK